jgi:hypothetical protein
MTDENETVFDRAQRLGAAPTDRRTVEQRLTDIETQLRELKQMLLTLTARAHDDD